MQCIRNSQNLCQNGTILCLHHLGHVGLTVMFKLRRHTQAEKKNYEIFEILYLATKTVTLLDSLSEITPQSPLFTKVINTVAEF